MNKLIAGITIIVLCIACNRNNDEVAVDTNAEQEVNTISDPDIFIGKHKAKAMVLGVFHFDDPGLDSYKPKYPFNILDERRQKELELLLVSMSEYKPTKILLELDRIELDSIINIRFQNYLIGVFNIDDKSNEIYQIGFRLAKKLGHKKVYCSDAAAEWFGVELDWDNYDTDAYLKSKGQYEKVNRYDYQAFYERSDSLKTVIALTDYLAILNNPDDRLKDHQAYLTTSVLEGAGDNYVGADAVAKWYRRNLRIFANAYDLTDFAKEERLLLIYGSGHVWQLRQFFIDSPDFEYVEANDYLVK
jgi:hypothetical protein